MVKSWAAMLPKILGKSLVSSSLARNSDTRMTDAYKFGPAKTSAKELSQASYSSAWSRAHSMRGFSMIEMMIVMVVILIATGIGFITLRPALNQEHLTQGYNTTLMAMRQARDSAVAERDTYLVTFNNATIPNTISLTRESTGVIVLTYQLPKDVSFDNEPGIPSSPTTPPTTPDGFGSGAKAIDFGQGIGAGGLNTLYFHPDGSAQDSIGRINNGVVYIARPGDLYSSRAITVWGTTGRLRGWRLVQSGASIKWRQQ